MATSPSQLPRSVSPNSDEEEVNLYLKIIETVAIKAKRDSTMKHIKALIQDKEQIDENRQLLFFRGDHLEDGKRLVDYGIHGDSTLHLILQDSTRIMVNVEISSTQKNSLVEARKWDTVKDVKLMIQAKEGIPLDNFDLVFGGKLLAEDRTLASLDLLQEPTFHLVFHPKDDVSVIVEMSSRRVTLSAKFWYTVRDVKAIVGSMMSAEVMSLHMVYRGKQLEDRKTLACHNIADGCLLQLVSPAFQIFVKSWNGKTVVLQVCRSDTIKEVKIKLLHKLQVSVPAEQHHIAYVGKRLADDLDLASYGIQENSTLFEIISPRSK
ncbi:hypothetical protein EUGRSUZ_H03021 [Eucalyptus grandis]|uniref:Ubiquitin-like domain-containing protein n=2 Tax=Eucalyptus grandis TaxID=71139 RepID=A0A059B2P7_EUCGR|nr:hypothetical protein EUGRSUZ_H03021 [Eucalyptus grandis]